MLFNVKSTQKWYKIELYVQRQTNSNSHMVEQSHFRWSWTTPNHDFKVTPLFDAEYLSNGTRFWHSFNAILIGTYTRRTQGCHFEWSWAILSDLSKYSMTRIVARSLGDSWASCMSEGSTTLWPWLLTLCPYNLRAICTYFREHFHQNVNYYLPFLRHESFCVSRALHGLVSSTSQLEGVWPWETYPP